MSLDRLAEVAKEMSGKVAQLNEQTQNVQQLVQQAAQEAAQQASACEAAALGGSPFMMGLTVFILAVFVGYYVVWRVTPALHSPLMAITNAVSSVIIVGALMAAGLPGIGFAKIMGFIAVILASVNIFGGITVTKRMLSMFATKKKLKV
jgi:NAD(P) transhydrogenase subunit alpha